MSNYRRVSIVLRRVLVLAACLVATPAFADGECLAWNVTGPWTITQSNGTTVRMNLQQTDTHLQGVGEYSYYDNDDSKVRTIGGPVDGYLEHGTLVRVTAYWSNRTAGQYVGEVRADGGLDGYSVDVNDPGNKATFRASGIPQCVTRAVPPPPVKTGLALGRVQVPAGTPVSPPRTICQMAASARARQSPAAPGLAKRCAEEGGPPVNVGFGRVKVPPPATTPAAPAASDAPDAPDAPVAAAAPSAPEAPPAPAPPMTPPMTPPEIDAAQLDALATKGTEIAGIDAPVGQARRVEAGAFYQLGFDIATGLFGDPILGAGGRTSMDAGSKSIRESLSASGQRGFDASMALHLARDYSH